MKKKKKKYLKKRYVTIAFVSIAAILAVFSAYFILERHNNVDVIQTETKTYILEEDAMSRAKSQVTINRSTSKPVTTVKLPVIMYHYVEPTRDPNDTTRIKLSVHPAEFERELINLKANEYKTYFAKDIPGIVNNTLKTDPKRVVLTFDDGYEDFYTVVFPLLKKYQMKGTVYVIYHYIGRKDFLNEAEIKEMIESGLVEIGSHTLDHLYLKSVSPEVAREQITKSKQLFEARFGIPIETFAYPFGALNDEVVKMAEEAGYTAAVTVSPGDMISSDGLYVIPRIRPGRFAGIDVGSFLDGYRN
ncbi:polysaccharide deacetylase family protein [Candidatus Roizmanbacteria bacterium]|nr:polysaccharide deacetylase family protein [Candidatus Roizmanbacteria bacterium]